MTVTRTHLLDALESFADDLQRDVMKATRLLLTTGERSYSDDLERFQRTYEEVKKEAAHIRAGGTVEQGAIAAWMIEEIQAGRA